MKVLIVGMCLMMLNSAVAQSVDPVHWKYVAKKIADKTYEVHISATMDEGCHIYSQTQPKEAISQPTKIIFTRNPLADLFGKPKEVGKKETYMDQTAGIVQYQYSGSVDFVQTLKLKVSVNTRINGTITYQVCTGEMCLPPKTIPFSVTLEKSE